MTNYIVITSIYNPTKAVKKFNLFNKYKLIVVGDLKTPTSWNLDGAIYLKPDQQSPQRFQMAKLLPWNHYSRKMLGYIEAMRSGAKIIIDTDDDNIPYDFWKFPDFDGEFSCCQERGYINVYKYFTEEKIWPRGFPLNLLQNKKDLTEKFESVKVGIWQFLANDDPDVDAIYRLVIDKPIRFNERDPIVLKADSICPINSQNTAFRKELFPLLYLPAFVNFRFTDILRGIVAQPILWKFGYCAGFGQATVYQERNPHDYMKDFIDEFPMYHQCQLALDVVKDSIKYTKGVTDSLVTAYEALHKQKIIIKDELELLDLWLLDLESS